MTYSDDIAVKKLKNGDQKAFEWIYNKYYQPLCFYGQTIIRCKETVEDIVQNFFLILWEKRETIHIMLLNAYMYQGVHNNCLKYLEHIMVEQKYSEQYIPNISDDSNNPLSMLIAQERTSEIEKAKDALPERCREVLALWEEGFSYQEIAEKLGIALGTVRTYITRATNKLRESLGNIGI